MGIEAIIAPLGLITQPNKMGVYTPGALSRADGCCMRSPNLLARMPDFTSYNAAPYFGAGPTPYFVYASDSQIVHLSPSGGAWELTFVDGSSKRGNVLFGGTFSGNQPIFDTFGRINCTRQRQRLLFNALNGPLIVDSVQPSSNAQALPRYAGFPNLLLSLTVVTTGNPGAIQANTATSSIAVLRRVFADGYEIVSPPSAPQWAGTGATADIQCAVGFDTYGVAGAGSYVQAGDFVDIYRTPSQTSPTALGATYRLSSTHIVTAAEVTAQGCTILDTTPDLALGEELYTNPGQQTAEGVKLPPPVSTCLTTYKGYTFFGNTTAAASVEITAPHGMQNPLPNTNAYLRKNGIGNRQLTATFTNTSNVLTAISGADIVGLAVGQQISDVALTGGVGVVTAVGATTVTLNVTANANVTKVTFLTDVMLITLPSIGTSFTAPAQSWPSFVASFRNSGAMVLASAVEPPDFTIPSAVGDQYSARNFVISAQRAGMGNITIRASNGQNYVPALPLTTATALTVTTDVQLNNVSWGEQGQPEGAPPFNSQPIGSGTIQAMFVTRDGVFIFCSDGLWQLAGTGGSAGRGFDWDVRLMDSTLSISGPQAGCVLRDTVYAYTNRGLVAVSPDGIRENISQGRINDLIPGPPFVLGSDNRLVANETEDEIWLSVGFGSVMPIYVYNTLTDAWTLSYSHGNSQSPGRLVYARYLQQMALLDFTTLYSQAAAQFQPITVDYQPVYDGDPTVINQWQDMTLICDAAVDNNLAVAARFNGNTGPFITLRQQFGDVRGSWSVPRNAPAVSNSFAPGFAVSSSLLQDLRLYGMILRSEALTTQRKQR